MEQVLNGWPGHHFEDALSGSGHSVHVVVMVTPPPPAGKVTSAPRERRGNAALTVVKPSRIVVPQMQPGRVPNRQGRGWGVAAAVATGSQLGLCEVIRGHAPDAACRGQRCSLRPSDITSSSCSSSAAACRQGHKPGLPGLCSAEATSS